MALVGNRSVLLKSPGRFMSGTVASGERSNFNRPGQQANRFQSIGRLAAMPSGHLSPSAWSMPRTAGGMSSRGFSVARLTGVASAAAGVNVAGQADFAIDAAAIGQLIASASGSVSFSVTASGTVVATIGSPGVGAFGVAASGQATALGWMQGQAQISVAASLVSYAIGHMSGTTVDPTTITPESVAQAVWHRAVEAGFTAEGLLRIIAAHAAGDATGLEASSTQFTGLDGQTVRIDGEYANGVRTITSLNGD